MPDSLQLTNRVVILETNFGVLHINMLDKEAPKTAENFIRLTDAKYYDGTKFHRMAKARFFCIIQGGDPTATGRGGESAFGGNFADEIKNAQGSIIAPELYPPFEDAGDGYCLYKKGFLAMANAGPNTNGSQFFIMLEDTVLPPAYTIFGQIEEDDFEILESIVNQVQPLGHGHDGNPSPEIRIEKATLAPLA